MNKSKALKIYNLLLKAYPLPKTELNFNNLYQLFVSVMLSAQCTDKRVNIITPGLFLQFPDFQSLANAPINKLISLIKSCGLFRTKANNLINSSRMIVSNFSGSLPKTREELEALPGIGRKSANVLLGVGFNIPAFPVDTHVSRISMRLGWSANRDPLKVEERVTAIFPKEKWINLHHAMILHGRNICKAPRPQCGQCCIREHCPSVDLL